MMSARLGARCKSSKAIGLASADGSKLTFWKKSDDGSGKGHLVTEDGASQPGVLFEINAANAGFWMSSKVWEMAISAKTILQCADPVRARSCKPQRIWARSSIRPDGLMTGILP